MGDSLYLAASGAISRLQQLEIVANNLANADTTGFKSDRALFHAALESALTGAGGESVGGEPGRVFVASGGAQTSFAPGAATPTGGALDVAIAGPGLFAVETPAGVRYTRAGSFGVDASGTLVTPEGHAVLGEGGPLQGVPAGARIGSGGDLVDSQGAVLGRLRVVEFDEPGFLQKEGDALFRAPADAVGIPTETVRLVEGSLERSNVQPVHELAVLMLLQRAYDTTMQMIQTDDQATERLIREVSE